MRKTLLAVVLAGCTPGAEPIEPPITELPAGVWEPAPGAWIWDADFAADSGTVWWAVTRHIDLNDGFGDDNDVWLGATTTTGLPRVELVRVDPGTRAVWSPQIAVTPSAINVAMSFNETTIRRFDRSGAPLAAPPTIVIEDNGRAMNVGNSIDLIATANGGAQLVAALNWDTAEVAIVDLDVTGTATKTVLVGTPDTTEPGGSSTNVMAAAARPDGSTIVAWDRYYNGCISTRPGSTLTAPFDGTNVGAIQTVGMPDRGDALPAVAAAGSTAYIVWHSGSGGAPFALAKYPDVGTVLAQIGEPNADNSDASIVLAGEGRGAITWNAHRDGTINVMAFEESGGTVRFGSAHAVPAVDPLYMMKSVGLVYVGDDRYVLGWIEQRGASYEERLYATELDLAGDALRPAPPVVPRAPSVPSVMARAFPCP